MFAPDAAPCAEPVAETAWIRPLALDELWFHTGTACNLDCAFCLEGARPGDNRLQRISLADVQPLIAAALALGVRRFAFTGGEPFVVKDMVAILDHAASFRPCLVLTNGTAPVVRRLTQIRKLLGTAHPISFRVSLDHADEEQHDAGRGAGNFRLALQGLRSLHKLGFGVSVARQMQPGRAETDVDGEFRALFVREGLPADLRIVAHPDYGTPGARPAAPPLAAGCLPQHDADALRRSFMCASGRMAVKQHGRMRIYACALVDDDPRFDQGESLAEALKSRVLLQHHRCHSCARYGAGL